MSAYAARKLWTQHNGQIPTGCYIHHIDGDHSNDVITNLECVTRKEHGARHRVIGFRHHEDNRLKKAREKKVMSREKLASEVKCSFKSIENYESGRSVPNIYTALRIARVLGTTVEKIWGE